jgi:hypothetical protein
MPALPSERQDGTFKRQCELHPAGNSSKLIFRVSGRPEIPIGESSVSFFSHQVSENVSVARPTRDVPSGIKGGVYRFNINNSHSCISLGIAGAVQGLCGNTSDRLFISLQKPIHAILVYPRMCYSSPLFGE